jgi:hypothetical protein
LETSSLDSLEKVRVGAARGEADGWERAMVVMGASV